MKLRRIGFMIDRKGRRNAGLIDPPWCKELRKDHSDACLAHRRRNEPRESVASVSRLIEAEA